MGNSYPSRYNANGVWKLNDLYKNLVTHKNFPRGHSRMVQMGGLTPTYVNTMSFITMETLGNASDFGDLAAVNVGSAHYADADLEVLYRSVVLTLNRIIDKVTMFAPSLLQNLKKRRSLGVGITGLAQYMSSTQYDNVDVIEEVAEKHYYYLLKASQEMVSDYDYPEVKGINPDWLPIDTKATSKVPTLDWESVRSIPRANSVLAAHMPCESSAVFSNATNGLYPVRSRVINKQSRKGAIQYIAPENIVRSVGGTLDFVYDP